MFVMDKKNLGKVSILLANPERFHFFLLTPAALERSSIVFLFLESRAFLLSAHLSKLCLHSSILFLATSKNPCATAASLKSLFLIGLGQPCIGFTEECLCPRKVILAFLF